MVVELMLALLVVLFLLLNAVYYTTDNDDVKTLVRIASFIIGLGIGVILINL